MGPDRAGSRIPALGAKPEDFRGDPALADAAVADQDHASGATVEQPLGRGHDPRTADQRGSSQHRPADDFEQ
jgi:hypothetical protein